MKDRRRSPYKAFNVRDRPFPHCPQLLSVCIYPARWHNLADTLYSFWEVWHFSGLNARGLNGIVADIVAGWAHALETAFVEVHETSLLGEASSRTAESCGAKCCSPSPVEIAVYSSRCWSTYKYQLLISLVRIIRLHAACPWCRHSRAEKSVRFYESIDFPAVRAYAPL